jgi:hypothetical protein
MIGFNALFQHWNETGDKIYDRSLGFNNLSFCTSKSHNGCHVINVVLFSTT